MILPAVLQLAFKAFASESARFPWFLILPLLLFGPLLGSNALIERAIGEPTDDSSPK